MITEDQIKNALYGYPANAHNPVRAVRALLAEAWEQGREAGLRDYDDRMPDHTPNPYTKGA
jgi:hypothetical protein